MLVVMNRILNLREKGLMKAMVIKDFLCWDLAPLRERGRPAWLYTGDADIGRTWTRGQLNPSSGVVEGLLKLLLGVEPGSGYL